MAEEILKLTEMSKNLEKEANKILTKAMEERKRIEFEKKNLELTKTEILISPNDELVELCVGGETYTTFRSVLTKQNQSVLAQIFREGKPMKDKDQNIFLDYDGPSFRYVLYFLRTGNLLWPSDKESIEIFKLELKRLGLTYEDKNIQPSEIVRAQTIGAFQKDPISGVTIGSCSSTYSGFPPTITLETNFSSNKYWLSDNGQVTNQWIVYDFPSECVISEIALLNTFSGNINPKDIDVQISPSNSNDDWETFCQIEMEIGTNIVDKWQLYSGFRFRAKSVRLFFHNRHGSQGGGYILLGGVRFFEN